MGFYLRKSISLGPLRFNLSKSGVGVSAGIKGLRVGTGPRGNYVHMGRGGLYYRTTLPSSTPKHSPSVTPSFTPTPNIKPGTHAPLVEIDSADVSQMTDSSSRELLDELNKKLKIIRLRPIIVAVCVLALIIAMSSGWPGWALFLLLVISGAAIYTAHNRDLLAKTTVLFYDFDPELEAVYENFLVWAEHLGSSARVWHVAAGGRVFDQKYHAGANKLIQRNQTFIRKAAPPYLKTNIVTIAVNVGRQTLHFFPDRLLVYAPNGVGAVNYQDLHVQVESTQFIEDGMVPLDAKVIDRTWRYVNKNGRPDLRFKVNPQLAVCLYETINFWSGSGLNEVLQISRCEIGQGFAHALAVLGGRIQYDRQQLARLNQTTQAALNATPNVSGLGWKPIGAIALFLFSAGFFSWVTTSPTEVLTSQLIEATASSSPSSTPSLSTKLAAADRASVIKAKNSYKRASSISDLNIMLLQMSQLKSRLINSSPDYQMIEKVQAGLGERLEQLALAERQKREKQQRAEELALRRAETRRASSPYITGPRGGCYYINSHGNKTYVDRSRCN